MNSEPIFIVGAPRSGTTLLSAMISSHSKIACGPETQFFNKLSPYDLNQAIKDKQWPKRAVELIVSLTLSGQKVHELFDVRQQEIVSYLEQQQPCIPAMLESLTLLHAKKINKPRWAEKTPNHILHLQKIRELYSNSSIIRIVRDPRDSANSMTKLPWASDSPLANAYLWNDWYKSSQLFFKIDNNSLTIRYEDLVIDPNNILKNIADFIGEDFEDAMLDTRKSYMNVSSVNEKWKVDVSKPLDASKLYQWKKILPNDMQNALSFICIDGILSFNYELGRKPDNYIKTFPISRNTIETNADTIISLSNQGTVVIDEKNPLTQKLLLILMPGFRADYSIRGNWKTAGLRLMLVIIKCIRKLKHLSTVDKNLENINHSE